MKFIATFTYEADMRKNLLHFLKDGGLTSPKGLTVSSAWIAAQTGTGYALLETKDAAVIYEMCVSWSEYGTVTITPVVAVSDL